MDGLQEISGALIKGMAPAVVELVQKEIAAGTAPRDILEKGLISGMAVIGERFKNNEIYVPEVLIAARAMTAGMKELKPLLAAGGIELKAAFAIGTVKGDLHDIGKNLVMMMMEGAGYRIMDLGVDVSPERFVKAAEDGAKIIGMSALLTTTMPAMKRTVDALVAAGLRDSVKVMIGGAPVTQAYADEIGADCYASDAAAAVDLANRMLAK